MNFATKWLAGSALVIAVPVGMIIAANNGPSINPVPQRVAVEPAPAPAPHVMTYDERFHANMCQLADRLNRVARNTGRAEAYNCHWPSDELIRLAITMTDR